MLYGPGLASLAPVDPVESRHALATRQMLDGGDLLAARLDDQGRAGQRLGAHWLQALAAGLLEDPLHPSIGPYRLPSALGAWMAVLVTFGMGRGLYGERLALLASALLAAGPALVGAAHLATADAVRLAPLVIAQLALAQAYLGWRSGGAPAGWPTVAAFWAAIGSGLVLGGPAGPATSFLTAAALSIAHRNVRWLGALQPLPGLVLAAAIATPWITEVLLGEPRWVSPVATIDGFRLPFGVLTLTVPFAFWPGSVLLAGALASAWRARNQPPVAFALAWTLTGLAMLELTPGRLPHHTVVVLPALALLVASRAVTAPQARPDRGERLYLVLWLATTVLLAGTLAGLPARLGIGFPLWALAPAAGTILVGAATAWLVWRGRPRPGLMVGLAAASLLLPWLTGGYLLRLEPLWPSASVARAVESLRRYPGEVVAISGYRAPSVAFLLGRYTRLTDPEGVAAHLDSWPSRLGVVAADERGAFEAALAARGLHARMTTAVRGLDWSRARQVTLLVYLLQPRPRHPTPSPGEAARSGPPSAASQ